MLFVHAGRPVELRHRRMHAQLHDDCASSETRTLPAVGLHPRHDNTAQRFRSLTFSLLTNTLPGPSTSEVTTLWRYTNLFIIIIIINEVNARRARLVPGRIPVFGQVYYLGI